jgi:hypothetical protein
MSNEHDSNLPISGSLPRQLYWIVVALAVWLVASVWGFMGSGYAPLVLTVVSLFILIAVALPAILARISRRHHRWPDDHAEPGTLKEWLHREFGIEEGAVEAKAAAIQVLLPIVAVAFGMTIFAVVHHLDIVGA